MRCVLALCGVVALSHPPFLLLGLTSLRAWRARVASGVGPPGGAGRSGRGGFVVEGARRPVVWRRPARRGAGAGLRGPEAFFRHIRVLLE